MTHLNLDYPASLLLFVRRFYRSVPVYTEPLFRFPPKRVWVQPGIGVRFTPESGFGIIPEWGFGMLRNTHFALATERAIYGEEHYFLIK
jgi:hypothetical protein